ncbi:MAG: hypothetical protein HRT44_14320, partial [Bdellovibrionales bacterium]|nr:hypothetical protein [Bdellovibrionales bacterium]
QVPQGVAVPKPTFQNAMLNGAATGALESGREIMEDTKNKTEQIYVKAGTKVLVVFNGGPQ